MAVGDVPAVPSRFGDGLTSPSELHGRIYPSTDVLGVDPASLAGPDMDDMGGGYGVAGPTDNPNTVPGVAGGRDVDPDDL